MAIGYIRQVNKQAKQLGTHFSSEHIEKHVTLHNLSKILLHEMTLSWLKSYSYHYFPGKNFGSLNSPTFQEQDSKSTSTINQTKLMLEWVQDVHHLLTSIILLKWVRMNFDMLRYDFFPQNFCTKIFGLVTDTVNSERVDQQACFFQ